MATGFDQGADDYIAKPFHPLELISRVKNVLRRSGKSQSVYRIATILDKGEYDYTLENRKSEEAYNTMSRKGLNIIMGILCGMLAFIGIANVFANTLGSIYQRKREFDRYISIGLTPAGVK